MDSRKTQDMGIGELNKDINMRSNLSETEINDYMPVTIRFYGNFCSSDCDCLGNFQEMGATRSFCKRFDVYALHSDRKHGNIRCEECLLKYKE